MIGVIDYGMGNLRSVLNALRYLDVDAQLVTDAETLMQCERAILPGVGAFSAAMDRLRTRGFVDAIRNHVRAGKPLLGICLGMQLLAGRGSEPVECEGLGLIPGRVSRLCVPRNTVLPHVGWNELQIQRAHPVLSDVRKGVDFYFVHSYGFTPEDEDDILATTDYGGSFVSGVARGNVVGLQFHPEKSQSNGLQILRNFAAWQGC